MASVGFNTLGSVALCVNLFDLNLSSNALTGSFTQFAPLVNLESLDVTNNKLVSMDGAAALPKLRQLELAGNRLQTFADFAALEHLPALSRFSLAGLTHADSDNPVCALDGYTDRVLSLAPSLEILNCVRVQPDGADGFYPAADRLANTLEAVARLKDHEPAPDVFTLVVDDAPSATEEVENAEVEFDQVLRESKAALAAMEQAVARSSADADKPAIFITEKS